MYLAATEPLTICRSNVQHDDSTRAAERAIFPWVALQKMDQHTGMCCPNERQCRKPVAGPYSKNLVFWVIVAARNLKPVPSPVRMSRTFKPLIFIHFAHGLRPLADKVWMPDMRP